MELRIGITTVRSLSFGWIPDPPSTEDLPFNDSPLNVKAASYQCDNTSLYKPISHQLSLPSCTANAAADFWEAALAKQCVDRDMPSGVIPDLSRLFLWYYGRLYMDPPQSGNIGSGCYNRLIMEVIARLGVPAESLWPYDLSLACTRPSITAQRDAFKRRSKAFYRITELGSARVDKIISALHSSSGVLFGTAINKEFLSYEDGVLLPPNSDTVVGNHAMVIVGFDTQKSAFKVRNSWGTSWGSDGYCWMDTEYVTWNRSKSFWTAEVMP